MYYRLAGRLDGDPFLLFELRGLSREQLRRGLRATPLGGALADLMVEPPSEDAAAESFYTRPVAARSTPIRLPENASRMIGIVDARASRSHNRAR